MTAPKTKAELQQQRNKVRSDGATLQASPVEYSLQWVGMEADQVSLQLATSYSELLEEFLSTDLRHVGNYTLDKLIGKGSFGKVYLARHNLTNGTKVVLKSSRKDDSNLAREIHHHRQFLHPHIARLYEVIVTESLVWLVLEYCPGDELYNYLLHHGALPIPKVQKIFTQLVGAVAYIHNKSCVHRDLKLENVLLDKHENVKLCDFGFTREYEGKANYLQTFCGTVCYSAPEMLRGEKYAGEKVDVWSLGIILYALIRGELPFDEDDDQATKAKILKDEPHYPDDFPAEAKALICKLLSKRPLYRPTMNDILADPFLSEHAPQQQGVLKLSQPAPFTTPLEKATLERMKSAGIDIDKVIENVLSQRCDNLAGWWALLIEKEERKESRRERKRLQREAEIKMLRRLSGASGRSRKIGPTLYEADEEGRPSTAEGKPRSSSRGRTHRRSTPQILVTDLPQLPEGHAVVSPASATPPPPLDKDSVRSPSTSRPPPPPKERKRRSSTLQLVVNNPDLLSPPGGVHNRRPTKKQHAFMSQLVSLKHWLVESTKRAKSPGKMLTNGTTSKDGSPKTNKEVTDGRPSPTPIQGHYREVSQTTAGTHSSYGAALTPTSSYPGPNAARIGHSKQPTLDTTRTRPHRDSLSPSPLTPHSGYRRGSVGLRGRKSTSSSVSSIRSMPRHATHSKASSASSNSLENLHSPGSRSVGRSPHASIKVLPATPTTNSQFLSSIKRPKNSASSLEASGSAMPSMSDETVPTLSTPSTGLVFARRKKSAFKGPALNGALFGLNVGAGQASPLLRAREGSAGKLNLGLHDLNRSASGRSNKARRKSQIIEEEEEEEEDDENEEAVEEVDTFDPVDLARGERVHSITIWDDALREVGQEAEKRRES